MCQMKCEKSNYVTECDAFSEPVNYNSEPYLASATPISYMVRIFWRLLGTYHVTLTFDPVTMTTCVICVTCHHDNLCHLCHLSP